MPHVGPCGQPRPLDEQLPQTCPRPPSVVAVCAGMFVAAKPQPRPTGLLPWALKAGSARPFGCAFHRLR